MKKLLYITVNSKPEEISTSKTVGMEFVNEFLKVNSDYEVEELDLYDQYIPEVNDRIFKNRAEPVSGVEYDKLSPKDKKDVDSINELCTQFLNADTYVIATPMWSISFPAKLKQYVDCIILNNRVIKVSPEKVVGLLDDKDRNMVYIQSSGGIYPKILGGNVNHGVDYFHDVFKFLGVKKFEKILVEGVDMPTVGREKAIELVQDNIERVVNKFSREPLLKM